MNAIPPLQKEPRTFRHLLRRLAALVIVPGLLHTLADPPGARAEAIACGQTITNRISAPDQTNTYTFNANAGEAVDILVLSGEFNAAVSLWSPDAVRIGGATNNFTTTIVLTNSGVYTLHVHDANRLGMGAYGMSLTLASGRCGSPLLWGVPVASSITQMAQLDSYTFSGNSGETVLIETTGPATPVGIVWSPTATALANWVNGVTALNLASTGTYTVGVYSYYGGGAGAYSLRLSFTKLVPESYRLGIGTTNGAALLSIRGETGKSTTLRYTPVFPASNQWVTLTNFSLPWSPYRFVDWESTNLAPRFYQTAQ